jgi:Ni,Fe-hydrogenase I cytochrome b subunit
MKIYKLFLMRYVRAVAVFALIVVLVIGTGLELKRRSQRFGKIAYTHWIKATMNNTSERNKNFHTHMWVKYTYVYRNPWFPVWPDPVWPDQQ